MNARPHIIAAFGVSNRDVSAETGPVVSLKELMAALENDFRFTVLARAHLGLPHRAEEAQNIWALRRLLNQQPLDLIHLNSLFDRELTIPILFLRWAALIVRTPVILSPRGEFSAGALEFKSARKRAYLELARSLGLLSDVWLHATTAEEERDILRTFPYARGVIVAPNLRSLRPPQAAPEIDGSRTRIVFLSRIDRMKNLDYAIQVLSSVRSPVRFDIYGPITHPDHWEECKHAIAKLPRNLDVRYLGPIPNNEVNQTLAAYDLFFLPSRGENFGHAIFDAFEAGLPVLISDRTPWRELERLEAGWSLPLTSPRTFASAIDTFAQMNQAEREKLRLGSRRLAERYVSNEKLIGSYREMFRSVVITDSSQTSQGNQQRSSQASGARA